MESPYTETIKTYFCGTAFSVNTNRKMMMRLGILGTFLGFGWEYITNKKISYL